MRRELTYSSLFAYCPNIDTAEGKKSKEFIRCLKNNHPISGITPSEIVARNILKSPLRNIFHSEVALIPVPRAAPIRNDYLWPSLEIAKKMQSLRLGKVFTLLERKEKVNQSSASPPMDRPKPTKHFQTLSIIEKIQDAGIVILVDDVVTRGHTFMGCAWKIDEAYPNVDIHAFAAIRTISNPKDFKGFYDPAKKGHDNIQTY